MADRHNECRLAQGLDPAIVGGCISRYGTIQPLLLPISGGLRYGCVVGAVNGDVFPSVRVTDGILHVWPATGRMQ